MSVNGDGTKSVASAPTIHPARTVNNNLLDLDYYSISEAHITETELYAHTKFFSRLFRTRHLVDS